ncbi:chorismate-binding protein [Variovorax sp. KK3]|uniref:chorismate-binding protein n=1 Tax=Variovorax sp. KK3 TaxID=1855728 RepID=UPI0021196D72|nr:chorismate-binding protein [Variovorax sp. KK3]
MTLAISARIDFACPDDAEAPRLRKLFARPDETMVAHRPEQVRPLLDAVHAQALNGHWCVGYLRYEAAPAFDPALTVHKADGPLAWFGIHKTAHPWPENRPDEPDLDFAALNWRSVLSRPGFDAAMAELLRAIAAGEVYQVNYTSRLQAMLHDRFGERAARALFAALQRAQPGGYAAYVDGGGEQVLSVSPELFFDWRDGRLLTRPMKGTAARGFDTIADTAAAERLRTSPKERAENVMVVDLLRNDLSRIAKPFSVRVPRLFSTEPLSTVWQMTSDVECATRTGCTLGDVFAALFPCGSVTGAPKVAAMRMIHRLEPAARGIYCGAVGVVTPGGNATFNVPIRTVTLLGDKAYCGIGSGVTADARAEGEWDEWQSKRAFLDRASDSFELLETMALIEGKIRDRNAHLARIRVAATHFGYRWDELAALEALDRVCRENPRGSWRVRLLSDCNGGVRAQASMQDAEPALVSLALAKNAFEFSDSEFVHFKTTRRVHYDAFAPVTARIFDTLLWNRRGEITECTRGNVALLLDGRWVTPPLHCGLLGGIGRARCLREGRVVEEVVHLEDLARVRELAFVNSLRGWIRAKLEHCLEPSSP